MARTFRKSRTAHPIAELNVTNLIDLGFTLLIIFMIATPLIQQEQTIPVNLPVASKSEQPQENQTFQSISIDRDGNYYFGERRVAFDELPALLDELAARPKPPVIRIRANRTLQYQQVIRLMDEIMKHNLSKITFDTQSGG
jgi:biopolymer transport protein ExbD